MSNKYWMMREKEDSRNKDTKSYGLQTNKYYLI